MLVTSGDERMKDFPDVPTFKELGYTNLHLALFRGIFGRSDIPAERIKYLHNLFYEAMKTQQFLAIAEALGTNLNYRSSEELTEYIRGATDVYKDILKKVGYID